MTFFTGTVVRGIGRGRQLGFPTANIKVAPEITSDPGIYAGRVMIKEVAYLSALYLAGNNIIEAFIFDFSQDIYDKEVKVEILKKIRDKRDFENNKEAIEQITQDVVEIKEYLKIK